MKSTNNEKITSLQKFHWFVTGATLIFKHKESSGKQLPPSVQFYYQGNKKPAQFLCLPLQADYNVSKRFSTSKNDSSPGRGVGDQVTTSEQPPILTVALPACHM